MCLELPSKVIEIKKERAKVKQDHKESCWVDLSTIKEKVKVGDYLIVYQKVAVNKIAKKEIEEMKHLMGELSGHHH
ncbi:MAG: hypothetical protein GF370_04760 [Candidatus Nealsonbacteria bacterium]|nr:hypothetical protein [Candidatus Nealsonbacteria bacterium]